MLKIKRQRGQNVLPQRSTDPCETISTNSYNDCIKFTPANFIFPVRPTALKNRSCSPVTFQQMKQHCLTDKHDQKEDLQDCGHGQTTGSELSEETVGFFLFVFTMNSHDYGEIYYAYYHLLIIKC